MRRILWAGLLALPLVSAATTPAQAQGHGCSSCGGAGGVIAPPGWNVPYAGSPFGCGGFCFRLFGTIHQQGPLVNYGPYEGYYPFEPNGPWSSDLRYHGTFGQKPYQECGGLFGRGGCGGGLFRRGGCGGTASLRLFEGVRERLHLFNHGGCSSCGHVIHER